MMNVNDGTDTTCPTCGSGARQSVIKLRAENERLRAALTDLRGAAETASVRLRDQGAWRDMLATIERANEVLGSLSEGDGGPT